MPKRNLTLAIDSELLDQVRMVAARRRVSLTSMVRQKLEEIVVAEAESVAASRRLIGRMNRPAAVVGKVKWTRSELHECDPVS